MSSAFRAPHVRGAVAPFVVAPLIAALAIGVARPARAQCGANRSTCSGCHDGVKTAAPSDAAWHSDHAFADLCAGCHGGNGAEDDASRAHSGMVAPLAAVETCGACHDVNASASLERYRAIRSAREADGGAPAAATGRTSLPSSPHGERGANEVVVALIAALALSEMLIVMRDERARRRPSLLGSDDRRRAA